MHKKIAITTTSFNARLIEPLKNKGIEITFNSYRRKLEKKEILEICDSCIGIIAGTEAYDCDVLKKLVNLKVISRCGAGIDTIDIQAAKDSGIKIFNTPNGPTVAVAELTVGFILDLLRKISYMNTEIKAGRWNKISGNLLNNKRVGIIGFGRIGRKVAEILLSFDCKVCYADPFVKDGLMGLRRLSLQDLLSRSDVVTVHTSGNDRLIGEKEIRMIKKGGWLINVSRGNVVDENALYCSLKDGHLAGAALDVFEHEPYNGPLLGLDNIILTPHIGSYAQEARIKMEKEAVKNLLKGLEGVL